MNNLKFVFVAILTIVPLLFAGCQGKQSAQEAGKEQAKAPINLYDKTLPEIKKLVNGKWELVSSKNAREFGEYENTFITFNDDDYIWSEEGKDEPGKLNWRKADTGAGYEAYLMDVFLETNPSYPMALNGDTLIIQDCSETAYLYKLVRRK